MNHTLRWRRLLPTCKYGFDDALRVNTTFLALHEPLQRGLSQHSLVDQIAVLELLAQPLQGGERFVQGHRHRDLAQVLPDVLAQQVPQVHTLRLSLGNRQLPPGIQNYF